MIHDILNSQPGAKDFMVHWPFTASGAVIGMAWCGTEQPRDMRVLSLNTTPLSGHYVLLCICKIQNHVLLSFKRKTAAWKSVAHCLWYISKFKNSLLFRLFLGNFDSGYQTFRQYPIALWVLLGIIPFSRHSTMLCRENKQNVAIS